LDSLPYAPNAAFNALEKGDDPLCIRGTRVDVLNDIRKWIDGEDKRHIFWLSGWAGTGKSTIARTVARKYYGKSRLVASYFFSKGGGDTGNATKFVGTIARQLAGKLPEFERLLRKALSKDKDIVHRVLKDQWQELIITPLAQLPVDSLPSPLIVVDALDECDTESSIRQVLQLLADTRNQNRQLLRILITSRPEVPIRDEFSRFLPGEHQLILQDISKFIVDQDISIFLKHNLAQISPEDEIVAQLVRKAAGLFIWAATACRFICEGLWFWTAIFCGFVREGLIVKQWLQTLVMSNTTPEDHLDAIYLTVLNSSLHSRFSPQDITDFHGTVRDVLGSMVTLFSFLSVKSLSILLLKPEKDLTWTMKDLHAILDFPKDNASALRLHHPSFRDFLLNRERCRDSYFLVDEKQAHQMLANNCIRLLSTYLKQDVCKVNSPGMLTAGVERNQVDQCLPPEVQYACHYWIQHLQKSGAQLRDNDKVHRFLQEHLLNWLEALSWMRKVSEGINAINSLQSIALTSDCPRLYAFIYDIKRFALYHRSAIEQAPLQIYYCALVF
ncbi:hypothetical protein P152DRAFT_378981, partial [Eremomyces bilateralis CBS 781.70]